MNRTSRCGHLRQFVAGYAMVATIVAVSIWITVFAYQRWNNLGWTPGFLIAFILLHLANFQAMRLLDRRANQQRDERWTCPQCQMGWFPWTRRQ